MRRAWRIGAWTLGSVLAVLVALVTAVLARLIVLGSGNFKNFDAVLVGYAFATLFAVFGITRRYCLWLQRPPTAIYWKRGWKVFFQLMRPRFAAGNLVRLVYLHPPSRFKALLVTVADPEATAARIKDARPAAGS